MFALLGLAACGTDSEPPELLAPQREALERAEDVERILLEAAEQRQRQLDDAEI